MSVNYESVIASYLGETSVRIANLFNEARCQRCVLFFDEFDVVGKERGDVHETGEIKRVVSSLLLQIDKLPSYTVVVTATNHPELLDRAVWRRFQLRLEMPYPTKDQIRRWLFDFQKSAETDFQDEVSAITDCLVGQSFAEVEQFCLDVKRRIVLTIPNTDVRREVSGIRQQWNRRSIVKENVRSDGSYA